MGVRLRFTSRTPRRAGRSLGCGNSGGIWRRTIPTYEVEINGRNFLLEVDGVPKRLGFYVLRYVDAQSPQEAARAAVQGIRKHESLANVLNERTDPPAIYAEDIIELSEVPDPDEIELGLSFYPEDDEP